MENTQSHYVKALKSCVPAPSSENKVVTFSLLNSELFQPQLQPAQAVANAQIQLHENSIGATAHLHQPPSA